MEDKIKGLGMKGLFAKKETAPAAAGAASPPPVTPAAASSPSEGAPELKSELSSSKAEKKDKASEKAEKQKEKDLTKLAQDMEAMAEEEKKEEKKEGPKYIAKPGDYEVLVHLIEVRGLKGKGFGDMSDPVVKVECFGQRKHTKTLQSTLNAKFDEVLHFTGKNLEPRSLETEKIKIRVMDANTIRRDVEIGSFEFDVASAYFLENHEIFRKWVALTDSTGASSGVQGYLRLTITALGPGDEMYIHDDKDYEDEGDEMDVLLPPKIDQKGYLLNINFYDAKDLMQMDFGLRGNSCDPLMRVDFAGTKLKTLHKSGFNVELNQQIQVAVMEPLMANSIMLSLFDKDFAAKDELMGKVMVEYKKLKENGNVLPPTWFNIYGPRMYDDLKLPNEWAVQMLEGSREGSYLRGRVLISMNLKEEHVPKSLYAGEIPPLSPAPRTTTWVLQIDVYKAIELPRRGSWKLQVRVGGYSFQNKSKEPKNGMISFNEGMTDENGNVNMEVELPEDPEQCPDIFFYLRSSKHNISYYRISFAEAVRAGWGAPPQWLRMKEDKSLDNLGDDEYPGEFLVGLRVGLKSTVPPVVPATARPLLEKGVTLKDLVAQSAAEPAEPSVKTAGGIRTLTMKTSEMKTGEIDDTLLLSPSNKSTAFGNLKVTIVSARGLPALDKMTKSSDPYCKIYVGSQSFRTRFISKSLAPAWNETFEFKSVPLDTDLLVKVKDHNVLGKPEEIGEYSTAIRSLSSALPGIDFKASKWVGISSNYPDAKLQFTVEFSFIHKEEEKSEDVKLRSAKFQASDLKSATFFGNPSESQFCVRVLLYSCRNLPASDNTGLSDPQVYIRCAGEEAKSREEKQTLNPTYFECLQLFLNLPDSPSLVPDLQIVVYDLDFGGAKTFLGRLSIPMSTVIKENCVGRTPNPDWRLLRDADNNDLDSRILMAFEIFSMDTRHTPPMPNMQPECEKMWMEIMALGLRGVNSLLGVFKPWAEFDLLGEKRMKTKGSCIPNASNPNLLQILKMEVSMPKNPRLASAIGITVKDAPMGFFISRNLGFTAVDLEHTLRQMYDDKIEKARKEREALEAKDEKDEKEVVWEARTLTRTTELQSEDFVDASPPRVQEATVGDTSVRLSEAIGGESQRESALDDKQPLLIVKPAEVEMSAVDIKPEEKKIEENKIEENKEPVGAEEDLENPPEPEGEPKKEEEEKEWISVIFGQKADALGEDDLPSYMKGRPVHKTELEKVVKMSPFKSYPFFTGQKGGFLGNARRQTGVFKGIIRLSEEKDSPPPIDTKDFLNPKTNLLRLYVLKAEGLAPTDLNGSSDPYLKITFGKDVRNLRKNYIPNNLNPEFYESFEFPCMIPGETFLKIEVWDYDGIGDDLIGATTIDVEDRYFSKDWKALPLKPVEWRNLMNPTSKNPQGKLQLWMDILDPLDAKKFPLINLKPPAPLEYELRVIVWQTKDVVNKDEITEMNDLYSTCVIDGPGNARQRTDTHLRAKKGKGSFNWRMKFPIKITLKSAPVLKIQLWDMDFFSANDSICEASIPLKALARKCARSKTWVKLLDKDGVSEKIWFEKLLHPNFGDKSQGKVELSIEMLPRHVAAQYTAGLGRDEPNQNPFLPKPEGRIEFNILKPWAFIADLLGEKMCFKIVCIIILGLMSACVAMFLPSLVSDIIANLIT